MILPKLPLDYLKSTEHRDSIYLIIICFLVAKSLLSGYKRIWIYHEESMNRAMTTFN